MATNYHPGQRIRCRGEEWQVTRADLHKVANGGEVWEVQARGLTNIVAGMDFCFMSDLDSIEAVDPSDIEPEIDTSAKARRAKLYWEANLRRLLPRNGALYLGQHGACKPYPYQCEPAARALGMMRPRILIGDAVGLGKTIECGILLSELIRRGKAKRVLCAVPKAILEQFQNEMWGRFAIPFHRLDSKGLERLRQELPSTMNPFFHFDKAIISIDTLKLKKYQKLLEDCQWDVIIVDECHNVADRTSGAGGSLRHRTVRRLANKANSVILMSATPHDGTKPGFASLIKLLDRTKIKDDDGYVREDFDEHFIRRTRSQVATELGQKSERVQQIKKIPLTPDEVDLLGLIHLGEKSTTLLTKRTSSGQKELFKTTLIKSFLSSPAALKQTANKKREMLEKKDKAPDSDSDAMINFLRDLEHGVDSLKGFSRLDALKAYLKECPTKADDRLVIFTERLATMDLLEKFLLKEGFVDAVFLPKEELQADGNLLATADGSMSDIELNRIVKSFQAKKNGIHILVATNVASEGLNLHKNCHRLIHFDLPWSLITLEQRAGRIDRLGQEKTPEIFYFASVVTADTRATKAADLKDDMWIVGKIEKRIKIASVDMDEQALANFTDAEQEEAEATRCYEEKTILLDHDSELEAILNGKSVTANAASTPKIKRLPTLFEKTPADFIEGVCKEAKINVTKRQDSNITIELNKGLKFESQQWPREFRPAVDDDTLTLESDSDSMQRHYDTKLNLDAYLEQSFMNEIHPAIAMLENAALGFFPGKSVPTVTLKGDDDDTVFFLIQSTLFNQRNDVVMQYWQVIQHKKGSPKLVSLFDMTANDHAIDVAAWLNATCQKIKAKSNLSEGERRRIKTLTTKAISLMNELTQEARSKRGQSLTGDLKAELARIRDWESSRRGYLNQQVALENETRHGGVYSLVNIAKRELETIDADSKRYNQFVKDFMSTSAEADIRILGCFIVGE